MYIYRTTGQVSIIHFPFPNTYTQHVGKASRELKEAGAQASYDALTSDTGRAAARGAVNAWANEKEEV